MQKRTIKMSAALVALAGATTVGFPATASSATPTTSITLGSLVPMLDSGQSVSYVGVPVSITCPWGQRSDAVQSLRDAVTERNG